MISFTVHHSSGKILIISVVLMRKLRLKRQPILKNALQQVGGKIRIWTHVKVDSKAHIFILSVCGFLRERDQLLSPWDNFIWMNPFWSLVTMENYNLDFGSLRRRFVAFIRGFRPEAQWFSGSHLKNGGGAAPWKFRAKIPVSYKQCSFARCPFCSDCLRIYGDDRQLVKDSRFHDLSYLCIVYPF